MMNPQQKIVPHFWFDQAAEQAALTYVDLLPNSAIGHLGRYGEAGADQHGQPAGSVMSVEAQLDGYAMVLINGGPVFRPTPALSLVLLFATQAELDQAWQRLAVDGQVLMPLQQYDWSPCYGWLSDRYGVSWQLSLRRPDQAGEAAVVPSLLFTGVVAGRAEEAFRHYASLFPDAGIDYVLHHDGRGADPQGSVLHAQFRLAGQTFMASDSALGHDFGFTEGSSLLVLCDSQEEIDHYWRALSATPQAEVCGWLKDRYGLSWQITPRILIESLQDPDPAVVARVTEAFISMKKLNIAELERARKG